MYLKFGNSQTLNCFTKAKGAKQNQVSTEVLAGYVGCKCCSRVSSTSTCEHGSGEI